MARLDARVPADLPARAQYRVSPGGIERAVRVKEISLGGALIEGIDPTALKAPWISLRPRLPGHGVIEIRGRALRASDGVTALKFFAGENPSSSELWGYIKSRLGDFGACPYCGDRTEIKGQACSGCGMFLDFENPGYLERHLQFTFLARIQGLIKGIGFNSLQAILALIEKEVSGARGELPAEMGLIGRSPALRKAMKTLRELAKGDSGLLIAGEPGTEMGWAARVIHDRSGRRLGPFVPFEAAGCAKEFLDPELFGFKRGSFRQAEKAGKGLLEQADGGSLFIDDIDGMPPSLQAKLRRFLAEGIVEPLGSRGGRRVDVRIMLGVDNKLLDAGTRSAFVTGLLQQLNFSVVELPPLRARGEDSILLARHFLAHHAGISGRPGLEFSDCAIEKIRRYGWPGNTRQLGEVVKRALNSARGKSVKKDDIEMAADSNSGETGSLKALIARSEQEAVRKALTDSRFVIAKAAKALEISRPSLYALMKKYGIEKTS